MTRDTAAEPRTAAGRALDQDLDEWSGLPNAWTRNILAIEAEAASGPALTTADVARALIESDLIPRYMEYARLAPSMNPAETIEHVAATWAPFVLARLAPAAAEPAEAPTIRDLIEWVEDEGHNANAADEIQIWYRAYLAAHPGPSE